jgi:diphthine synthase|tara:strand:- start:109 stop:846 length:738 start_codon:yes stop_codon:yes gene_type:complete
MSLTIIGLGLGNEKCITVAGLEAVKAASTIYLETYTSFLTNATTKDLEKFYKKKIIEANRNLVENQAETTILKDAKKGKVAFLVVGDAMSATTHKDLKQRAEELNIKVDVIPNNSIFTAIAITGLDLYKFGRTTTIPFENKNIKSPYEVIQNNLKNNLHTLVLLDLDVENKKTMTFAEGMTYLLDQGMKPSQLAVGCAQLGANKPIIKAATAKNLAKLQIQKYPQCLIIPSHLHFMEEEALQTYK